MSLPQNTGNPSPRSAGFMTKWFALGGLIAAVGLTIFDFVTSLMGIRQIMGEGNGGFIVSTMPFLFAALAVAFNALSSHIFRMYAEEGFTTFSTMVAFCLWVFFVGYDAGSSFLGIVSCYTGNEINSMTALGENFAQLGALPGFFTIVFAVLLSSGPFLCSVFSDLAAKEGLWR